MTGERTEKEGEWEGDALGETGGRRRGRGGCDEEIWLGGGWTAGRMIGGDQRGQ